MAATRIVMSYDGVGDLLESGDIRSALTSLAERVLDAARSNMHDESGNYERSLHIEQDTTDRVVVRVVAGVPYAHVLEANYGILARALDAAR